MLDTNQANPFLEAFLPFQRRIAYYGQFNALAQTLLKLTSPGQPDIYQGNELWDFSLVDPDNRRPVDFDRRKWLLAELQSAVSSGGEEWLKLARYLGQNPRDDRFKLLVTWQALQFRRRAGDLFRAGRYEPLAVEGFAAEHVCAFAWRRAPSAENPATLAVVAVPRLLARLAGHFHEEPHSPWRPLGEAVWRDSRVLLPEAIAAEPLTNHFTGQTCPADEKGLMLADLFAHFPVALVSNLA